MTSIKLVIFDWSGVICDDFERVYQTDMKLLNSFGIKSMSVKKYRNEYEFPYMKMYRKWGIKASKREVNKRYETLYDSIDIETKPTPGAKETLSWLNKKGIKVAVLSSKIRKNIIKEAKRFEILEYFSLIVGDVHDKKKVIKKIIKHFGVSSKETMFVGDTEYDVITGKKVGAYTAVTVFGFRNKSDLVKSNPDFILKTLDDLKEISLF